MVACLRRYAGRNGMAETKEYTVTIGGLEHTMLLDDLDAERMGAKPVEAKAAVKPANKARTAQNKSGGN